MIKPSRTKTWLIRSPSPLCSLIPFRICSSVNNPILMSISGSCSWYFIFSSVQRTADSPRPCREAGVQRNKTAIGANVAMMSILALLLFGMANYVSARHYHRFDLTKIKIYSKQSASSTYSTFIRITMVLCFRNSRKKCGRSCGN